ncbi:NAD(P)/FAD-dependent oxidoreductase [Nannocystis sp.]|uniref:NAD(P)/FAD-dependent oxidoreductase n=1 Tax=Nannocystis sp. TaxID=1962667 RepID=UPI0025DBD09E|nr:NAD(P)/FAD-dependent oxidoreductase [Nannocystis sp.]MBK7824978.1 NAD(P)/FAD-dependent oxidoreductase [Nannocystis sp.]
MRKPKVIVIGGGPSGGACALALSQYGGFEVHLLDKSVYPRVKVCGSGLSPHSLRMLERLGIRDRFALRHGIIEVLRVRGPDGGELDFKAGIEAWVVPRATLDHGVIQAGVERGVIFREDTKVLSLLRDSAGVTVGVKTESEELEADLVVCADGSPSRFSIDTRPKTTIRTLIGWWRGTPWQGRTAHMVWDRRLAGYYAWMFPEPEGVVNIGLTIPEHAPDAERLKPLFQDLLDEHWGDGLRDAELVGKWMGHPAVISTSVGPVAEQRTVWVGEAARLVSPGTVEGISFALESGIRAAGFIHGHFSANAGLSRLACAGYRARTAASVLPKFWAGEGVARGAQSALTRNLAGHVVHGRAGHWLNRTVSAMLGDLRLHDKQGDPGADADVEDRRL